MTEGASPWAGKGRFPKPGISFGKRRTLAVLRHGWRKAWLMEVEALQAENAELQSQLGMAKKQISEILAKEKVDG